jgi:hypothetical protein
MTTEVKVTDVMIRHSWREPARVKVIETLGSPKYKVILYLASYSIK